MSLLPLLRTAGALPLAQLNMRASGTSQEVLGQLQALLDEGLVTIEGDRVPLTEQELRSSNALVKLTRSGTSRAFD
jgi:predicted transcriptional regulator